MHPLESFWEAIDCDTNPIELHYITKDPYLDIDRKTLVLKKLNLIKNVLAGAEDATTEYALVSKMYVKILNENYSITPDGISFLNSVRDIIT